MEIAVLNYASGTVDIYVNIPDEWETKEIADYLHNELGLNEDATAFMTADDTSINYHKRR